MDSLKQISQFSDDLDSFCKTYKYVDKKEIYGGTNGPAKQTVRYRKGNNRKFSTRKQG